MKKQKRSGAARDGVRGGSRAADPPQSRHRVGRAPATPQGSRRPQREGALRAQRFDADRLTVSGPVFPVASGVAFDSNELAHASVSAFGTLLYSRAASTSRSNLLLADRSGRPTAWSTPAVTADCLKRQSLRTSRRRLDPNVPSSLEQTLLMNGDIDRLPSIDFPRLVAGADVAQQPSLLENRFGIILDL